jgi:hypothetical protein
LGGRAAIAPRRGDVRGLARLSASGVAAALVPVPEKDRDPAVRAAATEELAREARRRPRASVVRVRARADPEPSGYACALDLCGRQAAPPSK